MNSKGFLFTLAAILFAVTLVVFSQTFMQSTNDSEKNILKVSSIGTMQAVNDSIAFNTLKIVGVDLDINCGADMNIALKETLPKNYEVDSKLNKFKEFLDNNYFPRIAGHQDLDYSALTDGNAEIFVGDLLVIDSNYSSTRTDIFPAESNDIISIDLNVYSDGARDTNNYSPASGDVPLTVNYSDKNTISPSFSISDSINASGESTLTVSFPSGNVLFEFGDVRVGSDSFGVENNSDVNVSYSVRMNYVRCGSYVPVELNSVFSQSLGRVRGESMLKVLN